MKITQYMCILLFGLILGPAYGATIKFNEELLPLQLGSEVVEHSLFSKVTELEVTPGTYAIKLQYTDLYELDYDEHEVVESDTFWIEVHVIHDGVYQVTFDRAEDVEQAKIFAQKPQIKIISPRGEVLSRQSDEHSSSVNTVPQQPQISAPSAQSTEVRPITSSMSVKSASLPDAATMLDFWWQQASSEQRSAFLRKVNQGQ